MTFKYLTINYKLGLSNAVGLGIVSVGIGLGIFTGYNLQSQAKVKLDAVFTDGRLLREFQTNLLEVESHRKGLPTFAQEPEEFAEIFEEYQEDAAELPELWLKLKKVAEQPCTLPKTECQSLKKFVSNYDKSMQEYFQQPNILSQKINIQNLKTADISKTQKLVNEFTFNFAITKNIFDFVEELETLIEANANKLKEVQTEFDRAITLQINILTASLCLSIALATSLVRYIARGITKPLEIATQVAKQVSSQDDFSLRVPITSHDEVGILASTLNSLIERIDNLLKEQQIAQVKLIQSEKMSSLGRMVAGIAHEINNPVTFIQGNLEHAKGYNNDLVKIINLYEKYYPNPPEEIQTEIEKIDLDYLKQDCEKIFTSMQNGAERISTIVLSLRNFSRLDEAEFKLADIHEGIDSTLLILHNRLQVDSKYPEITIIREYGSLPLVECYPSQLNQVFMNIIINAIDALHELTQKRTITQIQECPSYIRITTEKTENNWVKITIFDNGNGIPQDVIPKIFDPFFTTKVVGKGTGLGLSTSYQIVVDNHGGKLSCESVVGKGTEFIMEIPIHKQIHATL